MYDQAGVLSTKVHSAVPQALTGSKQRAQSSQGLGRTDGAVAVLQKCVRKPRRAHVCRVRTSVHGVLCIVNHDSEASNLGSRWRRSRPRPEVAWADRVGGARWKVVAMQDDLAEAQHLAQSIV